MKAKWINNQLIVVSGPREMIGRVLETRGYDAQNYSRAYHMTHGGFGVLETRVVEETKPMKKGAA